VPYSALIDARRSTYLISSHVIAMSPSASLLIRARPRSRSSSNALLVLPDSSEAEGLPDLPATREEIDQIARLYERPTVLRGSAATKHAFLADAMTASVIHFAGHAVIGETALQSRLVFSNSAAGSSLFAEDVRHLDLSKCSLVVLAACESNSDQTDNRQGVSSLGRAFLAAGARVVVGSLWRVDDVVTSDLLVRFHAALAAGNTPAAAMRIAQLALLNSSDHAWAAFTVMGSPVREGERIDV
jgi:CHAT domain-containing protein